MDRHNVILARLSLFCMSILALILLLIFMGCSATPKRTRPEGMPYPVKLQPRARTYPLNDVRCLGGGIGGCSWGGKAYDGPVGR